MTGRASPWSGRISLGVGWALLDARAGDNRPHRHVAHQISLALETGCEIVAADRLPLAPGEAALIPAGLAHCLVPVGAVVRTIYVDPMFRGTRNLTRHQAPMRLSMGAASALRAVSCADTAKQWIDSFTGVRLSTAIDARLRTEIARSEPGLQPAALAERMGLSPARLREIAIRDFGVPTAKLLQWLQLQHAIDALRHTASLAEAAAAGGFADQAHFTRRLVQWFGVTPALGLAQLEISVVR